MGEEIVGEKEKSGAVSWKEFADGEKLATKLKKCWNKKCGKPLATTELENDEEQRAKVEKWMERKKKWEEGLKGGDLLKCSVCGDICKRAVSMKCCGRGSCRACAVKKLTAKRECWIESCSAIEKSSEDLENDELLREAVAYFNKNGEMDLTHAKKISALRQKLNPDKTKIKKKNTKKSRRQPPKNKKDKKKLAEKKKADAEKKTPAEKKWGKPNQCRDGRQNMFRKYGWGNNTMGQGPWMQPPMAMGGSPFMRNDEMKMREENMMMKRMLMKMNTMREMGPSREFAGNAWGDNSMMRRF